MTDSSRREMTKRATTPRRTNHSQQINQWYVLGNLMGSWIQPVNNAPAGPIRMGRRGRKPSRSSIRRGVRTGVALCGLLLSVSARAAEPAVPAPVVPAAKSGPLEVHQDGVRIRVTSSAGPTWRAFVDRRKGGIITNLCIPAEGDNLAAADGARFEGLCNLVYVDYQETPKPGKDSAYVAKGSFSYYSTLERMEVEELTPERVVVVVEGKGGNQTQPKADVLRFRQKYTFLPDRIVCAGEIEWLFDTVVPGSHPELLQPSCKFAPNVLSGELRIWDRDSSPVLLPQTNSK